MLFQLKRIKKHRMETTIKQLRKQCQCYIWIIIMGLFLSGVTAFPLETELSYLVKAISNWPIPLQEWIKKIYLALQYVNLHHPYLAYGTDWLAFAHLMLALLFIGPLKNLTKNEWIVQFGLICCIAIIPLALIAGSIREIPFFWQLIDCAFGIFGSIPLLLCYLNIQKLKALHPHEIYI
jgi:hypothetical protein